jgi:hypothetical protein
MPVAVLFPMLSTVTYSGMLVSPATAENVRFGDIHEALTTLNVEGFNGGYGGAWAETFRNIL